MNLIGLYIAVIEAKETYLKPGITEDIGERMVGYSKGGNIPTIHFLCISRPGFGRVVESLEDDGKVFFKKHFTKFNGYNRTEYINPLTTGITRKDLEKYYRKKIAKMPGVFIVKKEFLPLTLDSPGLKNFMENAIKYPQKYLEDF